MKIMAAIVVAIALGAASVSAQRMDANAVLASIDQKAAAYRDVALKIWSFAEVGYQETRSSALHMARPPKRAAPARSTCCARASLTMSMRW